LDHPFYFSVASSWMFLQLDIRARERHQGMSLSFPSMEERRNFFVGYSGCHRPSRGSIISEFSILRKILDEKIDELSYSEFRLEDRS
jgi:hypothetical protein